MAIHINPAHKGELRAKLGVKEGQNIPVAKLERAKHSSDPHTRAQANFAISARKFKH